MAAARQHNPARIRSAQAWECSGAVALEGEQVFAGPEDRFDPVADRREVGPWPDPSLRPGGSAQLLGLGGELSAGVALVAQQASPRPGADSAPE
jgi:hypothetical protein